MPEIGLSYVTPDIEVSDKQLGLWESELESRVGFYHQFLFITDYFIHLYHLNLLYSIYYTGDHNFC
jgi:hypothetical protein